MRFQKRDGAILQKIYDYDGVLAGRHIKGLFWQYKTLRAMQQRLSKLCHHNYMGRPTVAQWRSQPVPETVYWLGWKGASWIALQNGAEVAPPINDGENQMRQLHSKLRKMGIRWHREPRWIQLEHDLAVTDFRLAVEWAIQQAPSLALKEWVPEGVFFSNTDVIEYEIKDSGGKMIRKKKGVRPDGYFLIFDSRQSAMGNPAWARYLIEIDGSTHSNPKFGREKAAPGAAYIESPEYKARFGSNSGRWLVITAGQRRMYNLMRQTHHETGPAAHYFYFTLFDRIKKENVLTDPIWWQANETEPVSLYPHCIGPPSLKRVKSTGPSFNLGTLK